MSEMVVPFLGGVGIFAVILVGNLIFMLINPLAQRIITLSDLWKLILYKLPSFLTLSIPPAILFASSLAVARLGREGETTAMRMAGLPLRKIFLPFLIAGLLASLFSFLINEELVPKGNRRAQKILQMVWFGQATPIPLERVFFQSDKYTFYIDRVERFGEEVRLYNILVMEVQGNRFPNLYTASRGDCQRESKVWNLYDGILHQLDDKGFVRQEVKFDHAELSLERPFQDVWLTHKTPEEMNARELLREIRTWQKSGVKEVGVMLMEFYTKFAIPFACLILALIAPPFAHRFSRRGGSMGGFLIAILLFFIYYNAYLLFRMLGVNHLLPPFLAAWAPNIVFGAFGLYLYLKE
ncbi:MAG: LptF/LptG family permease [bacterium]